eukprot:1762776-Rhodomonas_salina.4
MSGTAIPYVAVASTVLLIDDPWCAVLTNAGIRLCSAVFGTEIGYAATRQCAAGLAITVLFPRSMLRGSRY